MRAEFSCAGVASAAADAALRLRHASWSGSPGIHPPPPPAAHVAPAALCRFGRMLTFHGLQRAWMTSHLRRGVRGIESFGVGRRNDFGSVNVAIGLPYVIPMDTVPALRDSNGQIG